MVSAKRNLINKFYLHNLAKRSVHYHADHTTALTTSHEHAKTNPLLTKSKGDLKSYQHPSIGRVTCEQPNCANKICKKVCGDIKEKAYIGHGTHSKYPGSTYVSSKDFDDKQQIQNGLFYKEPIKNHDTAGDNVHQKRTENLNNNYEMVTSIHIHASRNPLDD
jgi:hypothetical protein